MSFCNSLTSFLPSISKLPFSFNSLYLEINSSRDFASSSFCWTFSFVSENASSAASDARFAELISLSNPLIANDIAAIRPIEIAIFKAVCAIVNPIVDCFATFCAFFKPSIEPLPLFNPAKYIFVLSSALAIILLNVSWFVHPWATALFQFLKIWTWSFEITEFWLLDWKIDFTPPAKPFCENPCCQFVL